jgi:hypothetical protein
MTNNERELINIIRTDPDPEEALKIALQLIFDFLPDVTRESAEEPQDKSSESPREAV